jgi:hypothetical protein
MDDVPYNDPTSPRIQELIEALQGKGDKALVPAPAPPRRSSLSHFEGFTI